MHLTDSPAARLRALPHLSTLGFTEPNAAGRQYRHGTPLPAPRLLEIFAAEPNHTTTSSRPPIRCQSFASENAGLGVRIG